MGKKKISAKELIADVKSGLENSLLMKKYKISSEEKLTNLFNKLIDSGHLKQSDVENRNKIYSCPACSKIFPKDFSECPSCGIIISKYEDKMRKIQIEEVEKKRAIKKQTEKVEKKKAIKKQTEKVQKDIPNGEEKRDSKKVITLGSVLGWGFGSLFLLLSIPTIFVFHLSALMMIIMAAVLLPPIISRIENKLQIKVSKGLKAAIIIICFFGTGYFASKATFSPSVGSNYQTQSTKSQSTPEPKKLEIYSEGKTVHVGYTSYAVWKSFWSNKLSDNQFIDKQPDANWLFVEIAVRNNDKKERTIPPFKLIDENGYEYSTSSSSWQVEDSIGILSSLNPGVKKQGYIVFDVPKNRQYKLLLSGGYWSSEDALVKLNPNY